MFCRSLFLLTRKQSKASLIGKRKFSSINVERNPKFAKITSNDINYFKDILGTSGVLNDQSMISQFNEDWTKKYKGKTELVLRPKTTEQVSKIITYCSEKKIAVVPQGGNTGLVGGGVPVFDEIVLSTSLMDKVIHFDEISGIVTCQAGVILEKLDEYLNEKGFTVPLDLAAKGSCNIGGNVSTNAGGVRLLRYGSLHGSVLGLKAVLGDGRILDCLTSLRKDNTGYDLKQLFIGGEGTLGVVTEIALLTPPKPVAVHVAFLSLNSFENILKLYSRAKSALGEIISAFEFVDAKAMEVLRKQMPQTKFPFQKESPFYILIETSGSVPEHDEAKVSKFIEDLMSDSEPLIEDGTIGKTDTQVKELWKLRENCSEAMKRDGFVYKYDLSIPVLHFYELVEAMRERLKGKATVVGYGHVGDSNLHLNVTTPKFQQDVFDLIEPFVYEWTSAKRGSISAEHGLGFMKPNEIYFSKPKEAVDLMRSIKNIFDPNGILNPYKVLPHK